MREAQLQDPLCTFRRSQAAFVFRSDSFNRSDRSKYLCRFGMGHIGSGAMPEV